MGDRVVDPRGKESGRGGESEISGVQLYIHVHTLGTVYSLRLLGLWSYVGERRADSRSLILLHEFDCKSLL